MKKIYLLLSIIIILLTCSSCRTTYKKQQFEDEYFIYDVVYNKFKDRYDCYIVGLTELGKQQKYLILPEYYQEHKILRIGYFEQYTMWDAAYIGYFESDVLEKLYINHTFEYHSVYSEVIEIPNCVTVTWLSKIEFTRIYNHKGYIFGFNYYKNKKTEETMKNRLSKIANVSYLYNYEESPNDGYYWVDNYTNDVIGFIPPNPTREGYRFMGWYKEEECINEWDFKSDKLGDDIFIYENEIITEYTGTNLYAKWVKAY